MAWVWWRDLGGVSLASICCWDCGVRLVAGAGWREFGVDLLLRLWHEFGGGSWVAWVWRRFVAGIVAWVYHSFTTFCSIFVNQDISLIIDTYRDEEDELLQLAIQQSLRASASSATENLEISSEVDSTIEPEKVYNTAESEALERYVGVFLDFKYQKSFLKEDWSSIFYSAGKLGLHSIYRIAIGTRKDFLKAHSQVWDNFWQLKALYL